MWCVMFAFSGVDVADPYDSANVVNGTEASEDPFTLAANTISITSGNAVLLGWGGELDRSIVTPDGDYTVVGSVNGATHNQHAYYIAAPGTGNPDTSFDMSDAAAYQWILAELRASSAASTAGAGINRGLIDRGLINTGLIQRSMTKVNGIWRQAKHVWRPRLVPVGVQTQGSLRWPRSA
jgi:hypothetical protein